MKSKILQVAIETKKDGNVYFPCAGITLRGRKDFLRIARHDANAIALVNDFPRGIPGTVIRIDLDAETVTLLEPLRTEEFTSEREVIERKGIAIPSAKMEMQGAKLGDWLWEIKRCLDSGYATIIEGKLPDDLGQETQPVPSAEPDKSADQIARLCDLVETLLAKIATSK